MDELEWLKRNSPSSRPTRDVTRRHRTQLRAAIATEGTDGTRPRRPRRERRSRHRVLLTGAAVVAVCAIGAGVIALASSDGGDTGTVGAPPTDAAASTTAPSTCASAAPKQLAIPDGFGNPVAGAAEDAAAAPAKGQQVTHWSSGATTVEQRWPADAAAAKAFGREPSKDSIVSTASGVENDSRGLARRTIVFTFPGQPSDCTYLQVDVSGPDKSQVQAIADGLILAPFASTEPLVTTTVRAASAPPVVACDGARNYDTKTAIAVDATIGGTVKGGEFALPTDALTDFLAGRRTLAQRGYEELHLDDASLVYAKPGPTGVVTTVHVVATPSGWAVDDWQASGC
jgi:hypothetical protein